MTFSVTPTDLYRLLVTSRRCTALGFTGPAVRGDSAQIARFRLGIANNRNNREWLIKKLLNGGQRRHYDQVCAFLDYHCAGQPFLDLASMSHDLVSRHLHWRDGYTIKPQAYGSWRRCLHDLDEDLPVLFDLARRTRDGSEISEDIFKSWPTYLWGEAPELYQELAKGMACLHLHLGGSYPVPYYWVGLMNDRYGAESLFGGARPGPEIRENLRRYGVVRDFAHLRMAVIRARWLRWLLFDLVSETMAESPTGERSYKTAFAHFEQKFKSGIPAGDPFRKTLRAARRRGAGQSDYCQSQLADWRSARCPSLIGERWLNFHVLRILNSEGPLADPAATLLATVFWSYQQTKCRFLNAVQQKRNRRGFDYFHYHKSLINWRTDARWVLSHAREIGWFLQESGAVRHLEIMIRARKNLKTYAYLFQIIGTIKKEMDHRLRLDGAGAGAKGVRLGVIVHFIKNPPILAEWDRGLGRLQPFRRRQILDELELLAAFQKRRGHRQPCLVGIDAANGELDCPPEIFSELYRKGRHLLGGSTGLRLGRTYHVGEDFLNLKTGLRRLYEAIIFLQLEPGDRLGHASALGIDPHQWQCHHETVYIRALDILEDDLFEWSLWQKSGTLDRERIRHLEGHIAHWGAFILGEPRPLHWWRQAWQARGRLDLKTLLEVAGQAAESFQEKPEMNIEPEANPDHDGGSSFSLQSFLAACRKNPAVLRRAEAPQALPVNPRETPYLKRLQTLLRHEIMARNLSVESNPTSNWLIGPHRGPWQIPALYWLREQPEFPFTINPDNPSYFTTSLENEFFYIYAGLLRDTDVKAAVSLMAKLRKRALRLGFPVGAVQQLPANKPS